MTKEEAIEEINKAFEPAFANYIITALTEGATVSDKAPEQERILDKIKVEIRHHSEHFINDDGEDCLALYEDDVMEIIDKYRKEKVK